jgi:thiazole synthase
MVTVAVNRVPLDRKTESFLDHLNPKMQILPNTAGCYDADHAIRTARLAREALETDWVKLEVIGDQVTLLPITSRLSRRRRFSSKKDSSCSRISPTI